MNRTIDAAAELFSATGKEEHFNELLSHLRTRLVDKSKFLELKTGIPREEFESLFFEAVWEATKGYNRQIGTFTQRLFFLIDQRIRRTIRDARREKRTAYITVSLEKPFDEQRGDTYADLLPSGFSVENEIEGKEVERAIVDFSRNYPQHAKVVWLIANGYTNEEIAKQLGSDTYDTNIRQTVSRAKKYFKRYLEQLA